MVNSCVSISRIGRRVPGDNIFRPHFGKQDVVYIGPVACHALLQFRTRVW